MSNSDDQSQLNASEPEVLQSKDDIEELAKTLSGEVSLANIGKMFNYVLNLHNIRDMNSSITNIGTDLENTKSRIRERIENIESKTDYLSKELLTSKADIVETKSSVKTLATKVGEINSTATELLAATEVLNQISSVSIAQLYNEKELGITDRKSVGNVPPSSPQLNVSTKKSTFIDYYTRNIPIGSAKMPIRTYISKYYPDGSIPSDHTITQYAGELYERIMNPDLDNKALVQVRSNIVKIVDAPK